MSRESSEKVFIVDEEEISRGEHTPLREHNRYSAGQFSMLPVIQTNYAATYVWTQVFSVGIIFLLIGFIKNLKYLG